MSLASLLQRMIEAGTPADIVADVAAALAAAEAKAAAAEATAVAKADTIEQRRKADRERKAAQRSRHKSGNVTGNPGKSQDKVDPAPKIYNQTPPKSSEANASGGGAPPADAEPNLKSQVFGTGLRLLTAAGTPDRQARAVVGKWRRDFGDPAVFEALATAEREAASDPIPFITATLERRHDTRASSHQTRQHGPGPDRPSTGQGRISPRLAAGLAIRDKYARMAEEAGGDRGDAERGSDPGQGEPGRPAGTIPT